MKVAAYLMNSLPDGNKLQMLETTAALIKPPVHAVRIHMLRIMEDMYMVQEYRQSPFVMLNREEYIDIVIRRLELLPAEMIIQRLAGGGVGEALITPLWTLKKITILSGIDKEMKQCSTWQGRYST